MISGILLLTLVFPQLSLSEELLCFDNTEAKKMLVELKFGAVTSELLELCYEQYSTSKILNDNYTTQIKGLETDKQILKDMSEDYKQKYINANEKYVASEKSKPSKLTWFGIGFGSALLIGIISAFAVK